MKSDKKYAAFLSFADKDRELAQALQQVFGVLDLKVFFSSVDLPRAGTPEWQDRIHQAIKESCCFVPIFTRNSIHRPWVLYECGAADSLDLPKFSARVQGITNEELRSIPKGDVFAYNLYEEDSIIDLVLNVIGKMSGETVKSQFERMSRTQLSQSKELKGLCSLAKTRWVFIAGSVPKVPKGLDYKPALTIEGSPNLEGQDLLARIASDITILLLDDGFSVSSCSEVPVVGRGVADTVIQWICNNNECSDRYRIGGLYPIDRTAREADYNPEYKTQFMRLLMDFRKSYLRTVEWLIILGGNQGTLEEAEAAMGLKSVKICSIPSLGGSGSQICSDPKIRIRVDLPFHPKNNVWNSVAAKELVEKIVGSGGQRSE